MRVALVTWAGLRDLAADDQLLIEPLRDRGARVRAVVWDDQAVNWASFDSVVIRSTWDYHQRHAEFSAWLDRLESVSAAVWNPVSVLRGNTHKGYLLDLERRGVPVVPTEVIPPGHSIRDVMSARRWERAVVKPAVSASGYLTRIVDGSDDVPAADHELLVQPFIEQIVTQGEWSFIFLGGDFSHAAIKRAAPGDFRVQNNFGGSAVIANPPAPLLAQARAIVRTVEAKWLYARVDAVEIDGRLMLMELELTEPSLFLDLEAAAPMRMARAIVRNIGVMTTQR